MPNSYFKGSPDFGDSSQVEILSQSFKSWVDWGFVNAGAFYNVSLPTSGAYGGDFSQLQYVDSPYYTDGQVWQTVRSNLVWESGTDHGTPISVSGVYVDGTFTNTGYSINYPQGKVIFDTPISTSATVQMEHSVKHIQVVDADDFPLFRQAQQESFRVDNYDQAQSGAWAQYSDTRFQLPILGVRTASQRTYEGFELGNGVFDSKTEIACHVLAESRSDCNRISDTLGQQKHSAINLADINGMADSGVVILDYNGNKTNTTMTYPEIVAPNSEYRSSQCYFYDSTLQDVENVGDTYKRTVKLKCEILI